MTPPSEALRFGELTPHLKPLTHDEFSRIAMIMERETGVHLSPQKREMAASRLLRRLRSLGLASVKHYLQYLENHYSRELPLLINALTTNKTEFFREAEHFEFLSTLLRGGLGKERFYLWSGASSTGEEPYTLTMVLSEFARAHPGFEFRLLGTDIDTSVLDKARAGIYTPAEVDGVPQPLLKRYFVAEPPPTPPPPWLHRFRGDQIYRACPEQRSWMKFRRHNLMAPPQGMDELFHVVFLRNVLIYMSEESTTRILAHVARTLRPGGYLFVGHSETSACALPGFESVFPAVVRKKP